MLPVGMNERIPSFTTSVTRLFAGSLSVGRLPRHSWCQCLSGKLSCIWRAPLFSTREDASKQSTKDSSYAMSSLRTSTVKHWHSSSTLIQVTVLVSLPVVVATILSTFHCQKYARLFHRKWRSWSPCRVEMRTDDPCQPFYRFRSCKSASAVRERIAPFEKFCRR